MKQKLILSILLACQNKPEIGIKLYNIAFFAGFLTFKARCVLACNSMYAQLLEIDLVCDVCMSMCPSPKLLITSGMMWHDMYPHDWLNKLYSCYIAVVRIISRCGLSFDVCHRNQPNKNKLHSCNV